jgi:hypothetical protein
MIAFVVASSLSVPATETVLVANLCTVALLDIKLGSKLGSKLGTGHDRELCTAVLDIKLVSKLGTVHG